MFCRNCGNRIQEGAKFCRQCGAEVPASDSLRESGAERSPENTTDPRPDGQVQPTASRKRRGFPAWAAALIGVAAVFAVLAGLWAGGIVSVKGFGSASASASSRIEGEGFASPEDAVRAYLEALKAGDVEQLLSTFAVETYCERYDTMKQIRRAQAYYRDRSFSSPLSPTENSLLQKLNVEARRDQIMKNLRGQLDKMAFVKADGFAWGDEGDVESDSKIGLLFNGHPVGFSDGNAGVREAEQLLADLQNLPDTSKMEIGDIFYGEALSGNYLTSGNLNAMKQLAAISGAEGWKSLAIRFSVDGMEGLLLMDTAKYNGRWYNITSMGNLSALLATDYNAGGMLIGYPDSEFREFISDTEAAMGQLALIGAELKEEFGDGSTIDSSLLNEIEEMTGKPYSSLTEEEIDEVIQAEMREDLRLRDPRDSIDLMTLDEIIEFFSLTEL